MLYRRERVLERGRGWEDDAEPGEWWLFVHAAMILGLMTDARAGALLLHLMEAIGEVGDDNLDDWLGDRWAGLFANKPATLLDALHAVARDRRFEWETRFATVEALLELALRRGRLEEALAWIARIASDDAEQRAVKVFFASHLIDFPREAYRDLLLDLARRQKADERMFSVSEVEAAYREGKDRPSWRTRAHPWAFYDPEEIGERQRLWAAQEEEGDVGEYVEPYVREAPKIGRNDPCPCGSGKKYKRCCMRP